MKRTFELIEEYPGGPTTPFKINIDPKYPYVNNQYGKFSLEDCVKYDKNWKEVFQEYPLFYSDLVEGKQYITHFEDQGEYTFIHQGPIWRRLCYSEVHIEEHIVNNNNGFHPDNGFNRFREISEDEDHLKFRTFLTKDGFIKFVGEKALVIVNGCITTRVVGSIPTFPTFQEMKSAEEHISYDIKKLSLNDIIECWGIPKYQVEQSLLFNKFKNKVENLK